MFYVNILLHNTNFDPKSSTIKKMVVTTGIPSNIKKKGLFSTFIAYTKSKIKILWQNNAILHRAALLDP
jgi:hypothetical protein